MFFAKHSGISLTQSYLREGQTLRLFIDFLEQSHDMVLIYTRFEGKRKVFHLNRRDMQQVEAVSQWL